MHYGSGSVVPSRSAGFTNTGSPRPARPGQLDQMMADNIMYISRKMQKITK